MHSQFLCANFARQAVFASMVYCIGESHKLSPKQAKQSLQSRHVELEARHVCWVVQLFSSCSHVLSYALQSEQAVECMAFAH